MRTILTQRFLKYSLRIANAVIGKVPKKNILYFAYGANMDPQILSSNKIRLKNGQHVCLKDHAIKITLPCEYVGKGYASVEPHEGYEVHGILWEISAIELALLDICEWVPFNFYRREKVVVTNDSGEKQEAFCYFAQSPKNNLSTSESYKNLLVQIAINQKFPQHYIDVLKSLPIRESFELDHHFNLSNPSKKRFLADPLNKFYSIHDKLREKLCNLLP